MSDLFKSLDLAAYKAANASTRASMIQAAIKSHLDKIVDAAPTDIPVAVFLEDRVTGEIRRKT